MTGRVSKACSRCHFGAKTRKLKRKRTGKHHDIFAANEVAVGHSIPNDDVVVDRNVRPSPSIATGVNSAADQQSTVPAVASDSGFRSASLPAASRHFDSGCISHKKMDVFSCRYVLDTIFFLSNLVVIQCKYFELIPDAETCYDIYDLGYYIIA